MALGGGTFVAQNKNLPGAYINFVSSASASANISGRGIVAMPLKLSWGPDGEIFEVTQEDFYANSLKLFGYTSDASEMACLRDLFLNAKTLYAYKANEGGTKASNKYASARYTGIRGNDIKIVINPAVDSETEFEVSTLLGTKTVDSQTVSSASKLTDNAFVVFDKTAVLEEVSAGLALTGGADGTVSGTGIEKFFGKVESYSFNVLGIPFDTDDVKKLAVLFTNRMRDEMGVKFQLVVYDHPADSMGVISVKNKVLNHADTGALVYWVSGIAAACPVNKSNQNRLYNGEFNVDTDYTQNQLADSIKNGEFVLHKVGSGIRVLEDINTLVSTDDSTGDVFKDNQTVRVVDGIANDIAALFNTKYLGMIANNNAGRISLWSDIVKLHEQLYTIGAIENFSDSDITVEQGENKKSVVVTSAVTVANAMSKLYMTVTVN